MSPMSPQTSVNGSRPPKPCFWLQPSHFFLPHLPPLPLPLSLHTPSVGICEVSCWGAGVCGEGDLGVLVATLELPKLVFTPLQASGIQVEQHSLALSHQAWPLFGTPSFAQTEDVKGQS